MNNIVGKIFKHRTINFDKLIKYGFREKNGGFQFKLPMLHNQMTLNVRVSRSSDIETEVIDLETDEPYTLFLVENAAGEFVGSVRAEYESILSDIALNCTDKEIFKSEQAKKLIIFVRDKFGNELEYLWDKTPDCAIWRKKSNSKWYGALMTIPKCKLGIKSDDMVEIIDLRMDSEALEHTVDGKKYFRGYHMNKKHWITVCLDNSVETDEICRLIEVSYLLAK